MVSEIKTTEAPTLRRALKARHLTMIAIGGSIGTGLFVASGATISAAGPGGALFSYILIGLMVYFLMTSLGELAAYMPVSGSFSTYGQKYVEEGFGFALGWNYWYNWAVTIAVDLVAAQLVMNWWFPDTPGWIWSALFLAVIFLLNYISVRGFGEAEYWFSLIKVATVIIFIVVGVAMIVGIFKGAEPAGWSNWTIGDAPFARFQQVACGKLAGDGVVVVDPAELARKVRRADDHMRKLVLQNELGQLTRNDCRVEHHAVHALLQHELFHRRAVALRHVDEHHAVAFPRQRGLQAGHDFEHMRVGKGRVPLQRRDERNAAGSLLCKVLRALVGRIFELLHRGADAFHRRFRDGVRPVDHLGDRRRGGVGKLCHILDRCRHAPIPS